MDKAALVALVFSSCVGWTISVDMPVFASGQTANKVIANRMEKTRSLTPQEYGPPGVGVPIVPDYRSSVLHVGNYGSVPSGGAEAEKRDRRHRHASSEVTRSDRQVPAEASGDQRDLLTIYDELSKERQDKEQLKARLDRLEVEMNKILDVTHNMAARNDTAGTARGCNCSDRASKKDVDYINVQLRRMYLMINSQEDRQRDLLNLIQAYRSMVFTTADVMEKLEQKVGVLESNLRLHRVKVDKLNLDMHWRHVEQDITTNDTKQIRKDINNVLKTIDGIYADHGYFYSALDNIAGNLNTSELHNSLLESDVKLFQLVLQQILQTFVPEESGNQTVLSKSRAILARNILKNMSSTGSSRDRGRPGVHTRQCNGSGCLMGMNDLYGMLTNQQRQLDVLSVDTEQLKDEMSQFYVFLTSLQNDVSLVRQMNHDNVERSRDLRRLHDTVRQLQDSVRQIANTPNKTNAWANKKTTTPESHTTVVPSTTQTNYQTQTLRQTVRRSTSMALKQLQPKLATEDYDMDYDVIIEVPPTTWAPLSDNQSVVDTELSLASLNRKYENELAKETKEKSVHKQMDNGILYKTIQNTPSSTGKTLSTTIRPTAATKQPVRPMTTKSSGKPLTWAPGKQVTVSPVKQFTGIPVRPTTLSPTKPSSAKTAATVSLKPNNWPPKQVTVATVKSSTGSPIKPMTPQSPGANVKPGNEVGLKVKPSESDVCALPGIMVGAGRHVATFDDEQFGTWMRDPEQRNNHIFVTFGRVKIKIIHEYNTTNALVNHEMSRDYRLPFKCTGTGHVMFNGSFYCNKFKSNKIIKYNPRMNITLYQTLRYAEFGKPHRYKNGYDSSDIGFAVDEIGLWVVYSGSEYGGNLVVGKVNHETMAVHPTWETAFKKKKAVGYFMVCGRLYVISYNDYRALEIVYIFDTLRGQEVSTHPQPFRPASDSNAVQSINYNPKDSKLYVWLNSLGRGSLVQHGIFFTSK